MSVISSITDISTKAIQEATKSFGERNPSCATSIGTRLLFIAQLIMSALALPIILLVGLIAGIVRACEGDGTLGFEEMLAGIKSHLILVIPTSIVGIFLPIDTTRGVFISQSKCLLESLSREVADIGRQYQRI